jgi:hypothetical protein
MEVGKKAGGRLLKGTKKEKKGGRMVLERRKESGRKADGR